MEVEYTYREEHERERSPARPTKGNPAGDRTAAAGAAVDPEAGWTFVETLVVIGIVLILTGTVGFVAFRYLDRAKQAAARTQVETLGLALNAYLLDCDAYPTKEQGLDALWQKPVIEPVPAGWQGPYVGKDIPTDPWGNEYEYQVPGPQGLPFGIRSYGADGVAGGDGNAADIASWEG